MTPRHISSRETLCGAHSASVRLIKFGEVIFIKKITRSGADPLVGLCKGGTLKLKHH